MEKENLILNELQEIKQIATLQMKNVLTMNDVALITGLSKSCIYKLVSDKKIPYYKNKVGGKTTYFDKSEIEQWCKSYRISTDEEIEMQADEYIMSKEYDS